jgi:hypothetical protein
MPAQSARTSVARALDFPRFPSSARPASQVRPMFMLIVVAMLGMIPAAIATGIGSDIQRPLATVIVGGLASTLLLTLLVLPSLYYVTAGPRYQGLKVAELFDERDQH